MLAKFDGKKFGVILQPQNKYDSNIVFGIQFTGMASNARKVTVPLKGIDGAQTYHSAQLDDLITQLQRARAYLQKRHKRHKQVSGYPDRAGWYVGNAPEGRPQAVQAEPAEAGVPRPTGDTITWARRPSAARPEVRAPNRWLSAAATSALAGMFSRSEQETLVNNHMHLPSAAEIASSPGYDGPEPF